MTFTRYASFPVLSASRGGAGSSSSLRKSAHRADFSHIEAREGYIYVRSRAISSRTNDNFDTFPAAEIKQAYLTFVGKPVFVNHHNDDPKRARGVIVAAALHEDTSPDGKPDTWAEVLMEVDAVRFPKLAKMILSGDIDKTSMGCSVEVSQCSYCGNESESPLNFCDHIRSMKGQRITRTTASGSKESVLVSEICKGVSFFENSLLVETPADPTAHSWLDPDLSSAYLSGHVAPRVAARDRPHGARRDAELSSDAGVGDLSGAGSTNASVPVFADQGRTPLDLGDDVLREGSVGVSRAAQASSSLDHVPGVVPGQPQQPVGRVVADRVVASVSDNLSFRDGADERLVPPAVRPDRGTSFVGETESSVPVSEAASGPRPALVRASLVDLGPVAVQHGRRSYELLGHGVNDLAHGQQGTTHGQIMGQARTAALGWADSLSTEASVLGADDYVLDDIVSGFSLSEVHVMESQDGMMALYRGTPIGQITWVMKQDKRAYDDDLWEQALGDHNGYYVEVDVLVVEKQFRRKGVAGLLWKKFTEMATKHYGKKGFDPGEFTADGSAWWKSMTGKTVPVTRRVSYSSIRTALNEQIAPPKVDTLRDTMCSVCGSTDSLSDGVCSVCGFEEPKIFADPDTTGTDIEDLRRDGEATEFLVCTECDTQFPTEPPERREAHVRTSVLVGYDEDGSAVTEGNTCPLCEEGTLMPGTDEVDTKVIPDEVDDTDDTDDTDEDNPFADTKDDTDDEEDLDDEDDDTKEQAVPKKQRKASSAQFELYLGPGDDMPVAYFDTAGEAFDAAREQGEEEFSVVDSETGDLIKEGAARRKQVSASRRRYASEERTCGCPAGDPHLADCPLVTGEDSPTYSDDEALFSQVEWAQDNDVDYLASRRKHAYDVGPAGTGMWSSTSGDEDEECTCGAEYMGYATHDDDCPANPDSGLGDRFRTRASRRRTASRIDTLQRIVDNHQHEQIDGMLVDAQTANLLLQVYDALSEDKKAKFETIDLQRLVDFGWKHSSMKVARRKAASNTVRASRRARTQKGHSMSTHPSSHRRQGSIPLTNIGTTEDPLVFTGKDPSGAVVKFRVTKSDSDSLKSILFSDLAMNFSGVDIEESEIVKDASSRRRRTAARSPEDLHAKAEALYDQQADWQAFSSEFSKDELVTLWEKYCVMTPPDYYAASYDDEVSDALYQQGYFKDSSFSRGPAPAWLNERNNDGYGTPKNHEFWNTVDFEEVNGWRIFFKDGLWYGYKLSQNAWSNGATEKSDIVTMADPSRQIDVWASRKTAGISVREEYDEQGSLTLWDGAYSSDYVGEAIPFDRPDGRGYTISISSFPDTDVFTPFRADGTYQKVDKDISAAVDRMRRGASRTATRRTQKGRKMSNRNHRTAEYNGWSNRATWNAALWLNNDEGAYRAAVEATSPDEVKSIFDQMGNPDGVNVNEINWAEVYAGTGDRDGEYTASRRRQRRAAASSTCTHCGRQIENVGGQWIDPEADGDDIMWRETCDENDTFTAEHEPSTTTANRKRSNKMSTRNDANPAQRERRRLHSALSVQAKQIRKQDLRIAALEQALLGRTPTFASLDRKQAFEMHEYTVTMKHDDGEIDIKTTSTSEEQAKKSVADAEGAPLSAVVKVEQGKKIARRRRHASEEDNGDGQVAETRDQAREPETTDDPSNVGGTDGVDDGAVTPNGDLEGIGGEIPDDGLNKSEDVESVGSGDGITNESESERTFTSLRLARLRIQTGVATGDDLTLGQMIAKSSVSSESLHNEIETLSKVAEQNTQRASRSVPRRSQTASLAALANGGGGVIASGTGTGSTRGSNSLVSDSLI